MERSVFIVSVHFNNHAKTCWLNLCPFQNTYTIDPETGVQYCQPQALWRVEGFDRSNGVPFCYICCRVVLATGATDLPNRLGVPGELANPTWVVHDLRSLEMAFDRLMEEEEGDREGK